MEKSTVLAAEVVVFGLSLAVFLLLKLFRELPKDTAAAFFVTFFVIFNIG